MATQKQREAARQNIRKAKSARKTMSRGQHARAQPEGRGRKKPGTGGEGEYYHVAVRPKEDFVTFRTQDVGEPGHPARRRETAERIMGYREVANQQGGRTRRGR